MVRDQLVSSSLTQGPVDPTADIDFASLGISAIDEHRPQVVYATLTAVSFDTTTDIDCKTLLRYYEFSFF